MWSPCDCTKPEMQNSTLRTDLCLSFSTRKSESLNMAPSGAKGSAMMRSCSTPYSIRQPTMPASSRLGVVDSEWMLPVTQKVTWILSLPLMNFHRGPNISASKRRKAKDRTSRRTHRVDVTRKGPLYVAAGVSLVDSRSQDRLRSVLSTKTHRTIEKCGRLYPLFSVSFESAICSVFYPLFLGGRDLCYHRLPSPSTGYK